MATALRSTNGTGTVAFDDRRPERFDVAVIGAGFAGLAAAITAARAGRSVALFEQASVAGGRARTRAEHGFAFNIGPHALCRDGLGLKVLRDLGVEPKGAVVGSGGAHLVKEGRLYAFPVGVRSLLTSPLFDWRAKLEISMFLGTAGKIDPRPLEGLTVQEWLGRAVRSPIVRKLVGALIRTASYADDPSQLSAAAGLRQLQKGLGGVLYIHGGWQTIVDDLRARAEVLGVKIVSGAHVAEVELDEVHAVQAVRLADGRRYAVGSAILAVPPQQASALVNGGQQAVLTRWAERSVPVRAATLDVGLRRLPRPNDWVALGLDRPLYLSVHSQWANLAPEGSALVHVLRYLGPSPSSGAEDERELEGLLDLVQPGWREQIVTKRFMPDLTVAGALPSVAWEQQDGPRGPVVPGADGLFVAGDWVGPDGMLADRALTSGARAGQAAVLQTTTAPLLLREGA